MLAVPDLLVVRSLSSLRLRVGRIFPQSWS